MMHNDLESILGGGPDSLSVQVEGGKGEPEKLYVLMRPRGGKVEVREFRFGSQQGEPLVYAATCESLLAGFQRAHKDRRRLSEDMHRIRRWLQA